jgi:RND family efflux transporter MFP subunit
VKKVIATIAIIVVLAGLVVFAYVRQKRPSGGMGAFGRMQESVPVETVPVSNSDIAKRVMANGAINARAEVEVYPKQAGELVELLVDKGDKVKAGQTLGKIETKLFEIQEKQSQADLASAKAAYDKTSPLASISSETSFKQAKSNLDRLQSMMKQSELDLQLQGKQADVQVKRASADLRIADARLEAALSGAREQELEQAKVRTENAKRELDRLNILLKSGMISEDQVESAQLQYDIYSAQLSLLREGLRPEDIEVLKAQVEVAKASLESAESNKMLVDIKRSDLDAAKAQVESAQASFDQATAARDAATWEKELAQVEASVQKAEATLEMSRQRLEDSVIKAPINGIIANRFLDKGDTASLNSPFVTIVDMDVVKILAKVPAQDSVDIKVGDQAIIKPDVYPGQSFVGTVTNVSPVIDRTSQTCDVEVEAPNPDYKLKPGMFTRVEMTTLQHKGVPVVPVEALVKERDEIFVFVINDGKAAKNPVTAGISDGVRTEIISGLEAGDEFILAGKYSLREGMSVTLAGKGGKPGQVEQEGRR